MEPTTRRALLKGSVAAVPLAAVLAKEAPAQPADPFVAWSDLWARMREEYDEIAKRYDEVMDRIPKAVQRMPVPHLGGHYRVEDMEAFRDVEAAKHKGGRRETFIRCCDAQIEKRRHYERIRQEWEARVGARQAEDDLTKAGDALDALERKILKTPGTSLAAVVAKLRVLRWRIEEEASAFGHRGFDVDRQGIVTALDAAERTLAS